MPPPAELAHWFRRRALHVDTVTALAHYITVARPPWPRLSAMAFDHRGQFLDLAREPARRSRLRLQHLLHDEGRAQRHLEGHIGVLVDDTYGEDALHAATGRGWWVGRPVEAPARPLEAATSAQLDMPGRASRS